MAIPSHRLTTNQDFGGHLMESPESHLPGCYFFTDLFLFASSNAFMDSPDGGTLLASQ